MKKELWRQLIHASGVFIVFLSYILPPKFLIILCVAILAFVIVVFRLDHHHHIPFFSTIFRIAKRDEDERGFVYFFIGIILTAAALFVVVFLTLWSRHTIERIHAHNPGSLREIKKEIINGDES